MKYLIISDIHGSYKYLEDVLNKESFDKLILLGDILPHGPRNDLPVNYNPKKVMSILNQIKDKIICVRGNCDAYVDQMVLEFPILDLGLVVDEQRCFYLTHGHIFNPNNLLPVNNSVVLYGHTHISKIEKIGNNFYINPGSISIPKDGYHSYAILEKGILVIKDIDQNVIRQIDLSKELYE